MRPRSTQPPSTHASPTPSRQTNFGSEGDVPYLVMELLQGEDLASRLGRHPEGLPAEEAVDIPLAVCAGVHAAHRAGVIHRDLKPSNIFLAEGALGDVEPTVLDFGISSIEHAPLGPPLTESGVMLGTTPYLSPEQVAQEEVGAWTDQLALGVVLYECLTGRRPHPGKTAFPVMQNIGAGRTVAPSLLRPGLPRGLDAVVSRAMALAPTDRFGSAHALGAALLPFASPRKQVIWTRYFAGERTAERPPSSDSPLVHRGSTDTPVGDLRPPRHLAAARGGCRGAVGDHLDRAGAPLAVPGSGARSCRTGAGTLRHRRPPHPCAPTADGSRGAPARQRSAGRGDHRRRQSAPRPDRHRRRRGDRRALQSAPRRPPAPDRAPRARPPPHARPGRRQPRPDSGAAAAPDGSRPESLAPTFPSHRRFR